MSTTRAVISTVTLGVALYHFHVALFGVPEPLVVRPVHVASVLFLGFLLLPFRAAKQGASLPRLLDWALAALGCVGAVWVISDYERISWRMPFLDPVAPMDWVAGVLTLVLVLELTRRAAGISLPIIVLVFVAYTLFGRYFPGILQHPGVSPTALFDHLFLTTKGLYGTLAGLSLSVVFMFIAFGAFLQAAGASDFLSRLILVITRSVEGGPAKAAVISSAAFGTITGSGVANVYATGVVTIPLMIRAGYRPEIAAAVEAVASQLGQLIPPVMGAAAFLIAEFSRVSYAYVAAAAVVPAIYYVMALYVSVHIEGRKARIGIYRPEGAEESGWSVLGSYAHLTLPLLVLIAFLVARYTPYYAATVATLSVVVVSWLRRQTRMKLTGLWTAISSTVERVVPIASVLLCAGIGVATLEMTGVPYKITALLVELSGGVKLIAVLIVGLMTIILGFGMPVTGAFLIASLFGAPTLVEFGLSPFVAYMVIFMFALTANITPPVCIATFAAASIANCSFMRAGIQGLRIGMPAYMMPILVAFNPILLNLFEHGALRATEAVISALLGVLGLVFLMSGWLLTPLTIAQRAVLLLSVLAIIHPDILTDLLAMASLGAVYAWQRLVAVRRAERGAGSSASLDPPPTMNPAAEEERR